MTCPLSIIIPVAPWDSGWRDLLPILVKSCDDVEILLASPESEPPDWSDLLRKWGFEHRDSPVCWMKVPAGRAQQMNNAARQASGKFLWFLHADSGVTSETLVALQSSLERYPHDLHYFDLKFQSDGPAMMAFNAWGVWVRSRFFKMPFGDQGLAISQQQFRELGGFDESLPYGEDHELVWRLRIFGMKIRPVNSPISTSARKYRELGWLKTTCRHVWLTWRQALPLWCQLWKRRLFG